MRGRKLRSGFNLQGALKQKRLIRGVKQGLRVYKNCDVKNECESIGI
jgi:hypothetical protein